MNDQRTPVTFVEVEVGDTLIFSTRDNGFGGSGGVIERTGIVFRKTDKVIDLRVGGGIAVFTVDSRGRGRDTIHGATARLYRKPPGFGNWNDRNIRRVAKGSQ